jgi:hypothetical protein
MSFTLPEVAYLVLPLMSQQGCILLLLGSSEDGKYVLAMHFSSWTGV